MPTIEELIHKANADRLAAIALNFKESDVELIKGMTQEEFDVKYPKDEYEIYSDKAVNRFADDLKKSEDVDVLEKGKKDLSKLQKKSIIGKDGKKHTVWVKGKEESDVLGDNREQTEGQKKQRESDLDHMKNKIHQKRDKERSEEKKQDSGEKKEEGKIDNKFYEVASRISWEKDKKTKVKLDTDKLEQPIRDGLLIKDNEGYYSLTDKGKEKAELYFERHKPK